MNVEMNRTRALTIKFFEAVQQGDLSTIQSMTDAFAGFSHEGRVQLLQLAVEKQHKDVVEWMWPQMTYELTEVKRVLDHPHMLQWPEMMAQMIPYFHWHTIDMAVVEAAELGLSNVLEAGVDLMSDNARWETLRRLVVNFNDVPHSQHMFDVLLERTDLSFKSWKLMKIICAQKSIQGSFLERILPYCNDMQAKERAFSVSMVNEHWEAARILIHSGLELNSKVLLELLGREAFSTPEMVAQGNPAAPNDIVDYLYERTDVALIVQSLIEQKSLDEWGGSYFGQRWFAEQHQAIRNEVEQHTSGALDSRPKKM